MKKSKLKKEVLKLKKEKLKLKSELKSFHFLVEKFKVFGESIIDKIIEENEK
ncbi:hypothetical protein [Tenacibaculum ovolyticum]|uniref:hypothetical protein n=1 Tax=Tenacibaculum ovolyticum TaxID=104270 RepID=UPI001F34B9B7|nr:hypothetical protein [Tenacibaculum ovolyticum]